MSDEQKAYHELEMMQELGMLEKGTNIAKVLETYVEDKKAVSASREEQPQTFVELENQMVVGEYYNEGESTNEQSGS